MPTPVATAKQCLTPEAAQALDDAVAVARGRGHAQTTSLHAVSAFLSLPSSPLRDACFRARNAAFCYYSSPRAQIRALDFALSLSLDRSPASQQLVNEPPISNSLMAAIKRSQANQRRQPDGFGFKHDQGKEQLGTSGVKVEIQNLIVAILDDPIVSRVFNEAGFSSFDLKVAMVRPLQGFWRYSNSFSPRQRIQRSMFLCNQEENPNPGLRPFRFPFSGDSYGDEDFRRVGEVLVRKQGRNPLLFGVCAYDALQGFVEAARIQDEFLPVEIRGLTVVSVEHEILKFVSENSGEETMKSRFEELAAMAEGCCGPGLLICFGDLKAFVKDDDGLGVGLLSNLVVIFTKFLEVRRERTWLIGCATYEVYLKFLNKFPSVEKDWDLQPLAITSMKLPKGNVGFKSSLMGSFVPFAGFFPSSDFRGASRSSYQLPIHGNLCNDIHAQEVITGSGYNSVADRCQTTLPAWLCMDKVSTTTISDTLKTDDAVVLRPITGGFHSKWDDKSQHCHSTQTSPMIKTYEKVARAPSKEGKSSTEEKTQIDINNINTSIIGTDKKISVPKVCYKGSLGLSPENKNFLFGVSNRNNNSPAALISPLDCVHDSGVSECQKPLSSGTSVATDLVLGVSSHSYSSEKRESTAFAENNLVQDLSSCSPVHVGSCAEFAKHLDTNDFKSLFEALIRRIEWQEEAVRIISQTISHTRVSNGKLKGSRIRGDVWMKFVGPDTFGMRKTALALAEVVCGNKGNLIQINLNLQDGLVDQCTIFGNQLMSCSDQQIWRKTMVDHIADCLRKTPYSVIFLENLHLAHPPAQKSLLHAIRSGKFLDSHGREVGIGNAIFLLSCSGLETRGAEVKPWPLQQIIVNAPPITTSHPKRKLHSSTDELVKRAYKGSVACLDLNLPADDNEYTNEETQDPGTCEFGSNDWLEELFCQVDVTVVFKPFDYDSVSKKTSSPKQGCFSKSFQEPWIN